MTADEILNGEVCGYCECLLQRLMIAANRNDTITTEPCAYTCHNTSVIYNPNSALLVSCIQIQGANSYHPSSAGCCTRGHLKLNKHLFYYVPVLYRRHFLAHFPKRCGHALILTDIYQILLSPFRRLFSQDLDDEGVHNGVIAEVILVEMRVVLSNILQFLYFICTLSHATDSHAISL